MYVSRVGGVGWMMGRSELEHEGNTPPRMAFGPVNGDLLDLKRRSSLSSPGRWMASHPIQSALAGMMRSTAPRTEEANDGCAEQGNDGLCASWAMESDSVLVYLCHCLLCWIWVVGVTVNCSCSPALPARPSLALLLPSTPHYRPSQQHSTAQHSTAQHSLTMAELSVLHFRSLRATLSSLQDNGDVDAHQLRLQLDRSRAAFRRILDKAPPSSREKEELEKGG